MPVHLKKLSTEISQIQKVFINLKICSWIKKEKRKQKTVRKKETQNWWKLLEVSQNHGEPVADYINWKKSNQSLAANWQTRHAQQIEEDLPASSPKVADNDLMMVVASDDELAPLNVSFHADLTMEQAHAHFDDVMAEEQPAQWPVLAFR